MKPRQIYLRKKGKNKDGINVYAITGLVGKRDELICTIGTAEQLLFNLIENSTIFKQEKKDKIKQKINRTNIRPEKTKKRNSKLRTTNIVSNPKLDDNEEDYTNNEEEEESEEEPEEYGDIREAPKETIEEIKKILNKVDID